MTTLSKPTWHDTAIDRGIKFLIIFTPLALASVPVWASSIMQMTAFALFAVWLHKISAEKTIILEAGTLLNLYGLFVLIVALQLMPMPMGLLQVISPGAAAIYRSADSNGAGQWHPISLYPHATLSELLNLLAYGAVFLIVSNHYRKREQMLSLVRTIVSVGCFLVLIAVLQKAAWNGRIYWFYPIDPALEPRIGDIWGPYINRNHFAGYLEMVIPLSLGLVMYTLSRAGHDQGKTVLRRMSALAGHRKLPAFTLSVLAVVLMAGALFATLSRGGILAFTASMGAFMIMLRSRRSLRRRTGVLILLGFIVAIVGLFAAWDRIEGRFMELTDEDRIPRITVWADLTGMIGDFPVLGTGLGTFDRVFPRYQTKYSTVMFEHAENDYLEILTDMGFIGLLLAIAACAEYMMTTFRLWKTRKSSFSTLFGAAGLTSCSAIIVHSLTDFNLRVPANALLLTMIAALTIACLVRRNERDVSTGYICMEESDDAAEIVKVQGHMKKGRKQILLGASMVVILAFSSSMMSFIAERYAVVAERILDDPMTEERDSSDVSEESFPAYGKAIVALEKARTLAPLNSDFTRTLTNVYSRLKVWQDTMKIMGVEQPAKQPLDSKILRAAVFQNAYKTVELDPATADHLLVLGRIYAAEGMLDAALEQWIKAVDSYPVNGAIRFEAAVQMLSVGLHDQAWEQARLLAKIDDSYRLDDYDPLTRLIRQQRPPGYESRLVRSYLYNSMEILWRASARDGRAVLSVIPDNVDAREVARLFFEQKRFDPYSEE